MQNQAAVEALYSATFVEDYLDCVENLPNDLQRHLSRLREFDLTQYSEFLRDLDTLVEAFENEKTAAGQRQVLAKIQLGLIAAQDIGDDKLSTVQALTDIIEDKTRLLKHDAEILNFNNDDNDTNQPASSTAATAGNTASKSSQPQTKTAKKPNEDRNERSAAAAKRRKKASAEKGKDRGGAADLVDDEGSSSASRVKSGGQGGGQRSSSAGGSGKKMAKRRRDAVKKENKDDSDQDLDPNNANDYDPDEPTYCLCEQVSFGEMVCCDNDLCPYEWFHFECVHLTHKPKGKWFCPRCRGDKVSVMKPKSQFLKELDRFNKEKEAKMLLKQIKR